MILKIYLYDFKDTLHLFSGNLMKSLFKKETSSFP